MTTTTTETERSEALAALGFVLSVGTVRGEVGDNDWPCIAFNVALDYKGRKVLSTSFKMGVGHVDITKAKIGRAINNWSEDMDAMLSSWKRNPYAQFKDKALQARVAAKLALAQGVKPSLEDVLHSLLSDGEAFFNAQSFEDWASEYGYETDSRKAEAIYRECDNIGRKIAAAVEPDAIKAAREILQDY